MENDHISYHEKVMTWATVVMTVATLVMMYSGCQQSRLAEATERRAEQEERKAIATAKRQVQKAAFSVVSHFTKISSLRSKDECIALLRGITEAMDIPDNYYFASNPDLATAWFKVRSRFAVLTVDADWWTRGTNTYLKHQFTDEMWTQVTHEAYDEQVNSFLKLCDDLQLSYLFPTNRSASSPRSSK